MMEIYGILDASAPPTVTPTSSAKPPITALRLHPPHQPLVKIRSNTRARTLPRVSRQKSRCVEASSSLGEETSLHPRPSPRASHILGGAICARFLFRFLQRNRKKDSTK